jgi:uncharacterized protein YndB with AHSA1/START domain
VSKRLADHATFVIDRNFTASPAQVFAAWADPAANARWFAGPDAWKKLDRELDFRVGGHELLRGAWANGPVSTFEARYWDIVPDQRIVYTYDMHLDEKRISVSLATVEFMPAGAGTRMLFTVQAVFLDGYDDAGGRERGTRAAGEAGRGADAPGCRLIVRGDRSLPNDESRPRKCQMSTKESSKMPPSRTHDTKAATAGAAVDGQDRELVFTRVFDTPRGMVFRA